MRRQFKTGFFWFQMVTLIFILAACNNNGPEPPSVTRGITVTTLDLTIQETFPVQVQAMVNGTINDTCTAITNVAAPRQDRLFTIDIQFSFTDTGACTAGSIPFSQVVTLDVLNLPAGDYTVTAGELSRTFNLAVFNGIEESPPPTNGGTTLTPAVTSALAGQSVTVTGQGFPANAQVEISMGLVNGDRSAMLTVPAGADGSFTTQVVIPSNSIPNEQWVVGATANGVTTLSAPVTVVAEVVQPPTETTTEGGVNVATNGLFSKTNIYLISLNDGGPIGCNDSVVPVAVDIQPTVAPMTAAYNKLFSIKEQNYGEPSRYNALYQSNLTVAGINIVNREAIVSLTGTLTLGGECDDPRVKAQLTQIALQYSTVDRVTIWLNGEVYTFTNQPTSPPGRG